MSLFVFKFSNYIEANSTPDWPEDKCYNSYTGEKIGNT